MFKSQNIGQYKIIKPIQHIQSAFLVQSKNKCLFVAKLLLINCSVQSYCIMETDLKFISSMHDNYLVSIQEYFLLENGRTLVIIFQECLHSVLNHEIKLLNRNKLAELMIQICKAIENLHQQGIVCGYLQRNNIFIKVNKVKILYFQSTFLTQAILQSSILQQKQYTPNINNTYQNDNYLLAIILAEILLGKSIPKNDFSSLINQLKQNSIDQFYIDLISSMMNSNIQQRPNITYVRTLIYKFNNNQYDTDLGESKFRFIQMSNLNNIHSFQKNILDIHKQKIWTFTNIEKYKPYFPNLMELNLNLTNITNQLLQNTLSQCKNLRSLYCSNTLLNDQCGLFILKYSSDLSVLSIGGNKLTHEFILHIQDQIDQLQTLEIPFTNITDKSIQIMTQKMINLIKLDISFTRVTSDGLIKLFSMKKLKSIAFWSDQYLFKYWEFINLNYSRNFYKFIYNQIHLTKQFLIKFKKEVSRFTQITINLSGNQINQIINDLNDSIILLEINGLVSQASCIRKILKNQKLKSIYLKDIKLKNIDIITPFNFTKKFLSKSIQSLNLIHCGFDSNLIQNLNQQSIKHLILQHCNFDQIQYLEIIPKFTNLQYLNLSNTNVTTNFMTKISAKLKNIKYLNLNNTEITDKAVLNISVNCINLIVLSLNYTKITDNSLTHIQKLKNLKYLNLNKTQVADKGVKQICKINALNVLGLNNTNATDTAVKYICQNMKQLQILDLNNTHISDMSVKLISQNLVKLIVLGLNNTDVTDESIQEISRRLTSLQFLSLNNTNISDISLNIISENLINLFWISLNKTKISNKSILNLLKKLHKLRKIELNGIHLDQQTLLILQSKPLVKYFNSQI